MSNNDVINAANAFHASIHLGITSLDLDPLYTFQAAVRDLNRRWPFLGDIMRAELTSQRRPTVDDENVIIFPKEFEPCT